MKHLATLDDYDAIAKIVKLYQDYAFRGLWLTKVKEAIKQKRVLYWKNTFVIFSVYKRKTWLGERRALPGDVNIQYIGTLNPGDGSAAAMKAYYHALFADRNIWSTVRKDNMRAIQSSKKAGLRIVSTITWKDGTIPGYVMLKEKSSETR